MLLSSISTFVAIHRSRRRIKSVSQVNSISRGVRLGLTMIFLNISFFLVNVPMPLFNALTIYTNLKNKTDRYTIFILESIIMLLFFSFYSISFYIQLVTNSLVRGEFKGLLKTIVCLKDSININILLQREARRNRN